MPRNHNTSATVMYLLTIVFHILKTWSPAQMWIYILYLINVTRSVTGGNCTIPKHKTQFGLSSFSSGHELVKQPSTEWIFCIHINSHVYQSNGFWVVKLAQFIKLRDYL